MENAPNWKVGGVWAVWSGYLEQNGATILPFALADGRFGRLLRCVLLHLLLILLHGFANDYRGLHVM